MPTDVARAARDSVLAPACLFGIDADVSTRIRFTTRFAPTTSSSEGHESCRSWWRLPLNYSTCLRRGSRVSRSQSPRKLLASTSRKMATPGKNAIHQALPR